MNIESWKRTYKKADGTLQSSPIYGSFRELGDLLVCTRPLAVRPEGRADFRL